MRMYFENYFNEYCSELKHFGQTDELRYNSGEREKEKWLMNAQALSVRDAIITRRSIKNFNGQPVDPENIAEILEDAAWAPNHGNRNPWRFVVAADKEYVKFLDVLREYGIPKWKELSEEDLERANEEV